VAQAEALNAAEALSAYLRLPRGRWVWKQEWQPTSIEPFEGRLTIDPETAGDWLGRRRFDPQKVAEFERAMREGLWRDGDPIILRASALGDGAHRLAAIGLFARPLVLWVRFEP
jgi:hypothetical protein